MGNGYLSVADAEDLSLRCAGLPEEDLQRALVELAEQFDYNVERIVRERFQSGAFLRLTSVHAGGDLTAQLPVSTPFVFVRGDPGDPLRPLAVVALTRQEFPEIWASNAELVWIRKRLKGANRDAWAK
jgi:hypothetical protein